jgi:hypothetical protein
VSVQRSLYKRIEDRTGKSNTTLTGDRIQKLNDIDFEWVARDHRTVPWEARYQELVAFVRRYGHSQVPIGWEVSTTSDRKLTPNDPKPHRSRLPWDLPTMTGQCAIGDVGFDAGMFPSTTFH